MILLKIRCRPKRDGKYRTYRRLSANPFTTNEVSQKCTLHSVCKHGRYESTYVYYERTSQL